MKAFLMYRDRDFDLTAGLPSHAAVLTQDLGLDTLFRAMSAEDPFLLECATQAVLAGLHEPDAILYRQQILADCLEQPAIVREMYGIAVEAVEREKKTWGWMSVKYPDGTLHRSIEVLRVFVDLLKRLRRLAHERRADFRSEGFRRLFEMFAAELDDEYMGTVQDHLKRLEFRNGILMSASLGKGNKGTNYVLRKPSDTGPGWIERFQGWLAQFSRGKGSNYMYEIADRDETGFRALSDLRARGIGHVAAALAQSTDHILSFFGILRLELGFYISCLNLRDRLARKGEPICLPDPLAAGTPTLSCRGLYDISLSLNMDERAVGNDLAGENRLLVMITGANRGGKSTFLRSIGVAQLMMQCGMFVPAASFRANVCHGIGRC